MVIKVNENASSLIISSESRGPQHLRRPTDEDRLQLRLHLPPKSSLFVLTKRLYFRINRRYLTMSTAISNQASNFKAEAPSDRQANFAL